MCFIELLLDRTMNPVDLHWKYLKIKTIRDAPLFSRPSTSTYIWVLAVSTCSLFKTCLLVHVINIPSEDVPRGNIPVLPVHVAKGIMLHGFPDGSLVR